MKLNIKKFMMTEMGGELEETIKAWDQALEERRKATPGIGDPDQGLGFGYWDRTCKSCQDRWEVFKLAIRQFYGIEFNFTRTDECFGICNDDETMILSRLVDTFFSRISLTMQLHPKPHSTAYVLPWEEVLHWQCRSSDCSSS